MLGVVVVLLVYFISSRDMLFSAIVVLLSSCPCNGSDDCAAHGGLLLPRLLPQDLHHTTGLNSVNGVAGRLPNEQFSPTRPTASGVASDRRARSLSAVR